MMNFKTRDLIRYRWLLLLVLSVWPWNGEISTARTLYADLFPAVAMWYWGFDLARSGRRRLFEGILSRETERWVLFGVAACAAVILSTSAGSYDLARRGEELMYLAGGMTIKRQGYRIGRKQPLEWWEWADELKYGAVGQLVMMLFGAGVIIVTGQAGALALLLVVMPIGMIALADEPVYGIEGRHVMRYLLRMRRRHFGVADEAW